MENQEIIKKRGRPKGSKNYGNEQECEEANRKSKSQYIKNKEWFCYRMNGKTSHLHTVKQKN